MNIDGDASLDVAVFSSIMFFSGELQEEVACGKMISSTASDDSFTRLDFSGIFDPSRQSVCD